MAGLTDKQAEVVRLIQQGARLYARKRKRSAGGRKSLTSYFLDCSKNPYERDDVRHVHRAVIEGLIIKKAIVQVSGSLKVNDALFSNAIVSSSS